MKCCGNEGEAPELEVQYQIQDTSYFYAVFVFCPGCKKHTQVAMTRNNEMTHFQHREIGRLTLEDRGSTGSLYIIYPYPGDLGGS